MAIDWGDASAWAAFAISLGAAGLAARGLKWQKISAEATVKSANAAEKATALTELMVKSQLAGKPDAHQGHDVKWSLERRKDRFILRNVGTAIATDVNVDGKGIARVASQVPTDAAVRPGESVSFMMAGSLAYAVPDEIEVTWGGHPEPMILPVPPR
ncbi:hypothetical protein GCM10017559_08380 [Streptosporangium longisporum]|uniref:Uncharacterized protein n=1 Tax=Streptosporangium longisporum TaxID=46187 RepID=A0ABN3XRZ7_9ACTN